MRIRVVQGFGGYEPGQVFDDWPDGMCEIFIGRGMVEKVDVPEGEAAEDEPEVERAEVPNRRKRK